MRGSRAQSRGIERALRGGKIAAGKMIARPPSGQGEDQHEDRHGHARALAAAANEGERASEHEDRRDGDDRPYRERHDAGQIEGRFPTAIEHEPLLPRAVWLNGGGGGHPRRAFAHARPRA